MVALQYDFGIYLSLFSLSFHESTYTPVCVLRMQLQSTLAGFSWGRSRSGRELQGWWGSHSLAPSLSLSLVLFLSHSLCVCVSGPAVGPGDVDGERDTSGPWWLRLPEPRLAGWRRLAADRSARCWIPAVGGDWMQRVGTEWHKPRRLSVPLARHSPCPGARVSPALRRCWHDGKCLRCFPQLLEDVCNTEGSSW